MKTKKIKHDHPARRAYSDLPAVELDRIADKFDKEFVPTRPLTPRMKALVRRAKRHPGRPRIGQGAAKIRISVERGLLHRVDAVAKTKKLTRSELIARGLETILSQAS